MPTGAKSGVSKAIEKGVLGVVEVPSADQGGPGSSAKVPEPASQVSPSSFKGEILLKGCKQVMSHISMPMLATLYHHGDGTAPSFVALTTHKARHYFVDIRLQ